MTRRSSYSSDATRATRGSVLARSCLLELEVRRVERAELRPDDELTTGVRPGRIGLPDVGVHAGRRVEAQAAPTGGHRRLDRVERRRAAAVDRLGSRIRRVVEDIQPPVP